MMRAVSTLDRFPELPMTTRTCFPAAILCLGLGLTLLGASLPGHAADKPREASFGKGKASGSLLTMAQLRECLNQQERVRTLADETLKEQAVLAASKAEIERVAVTLQERLPALDRTDAEAVAAYNAQVQSRERSIGEYEKSVPAFNTRVETLQTERTAFAKNCENRRYDENNEIAIRKGK